MDSSKQCVLFLVFISGIVLNYADIYSDIRVAFPEDPCDVTEIQMPNFNAQKQRISDTKCLEYTWRLRYEQGKLVNEIRCLEKRNYTFLLGGSEAIDGEYPHMAALGWKAKIGTWIFKCGSSLISERYTLTAAHCSQVKKNDMSVAFYEPKIVRLGSKSIADYVRNLSPLGNRPVALPIGCRIAVRLGELTNNVTNFCSIEKHSKDATTGINDGRYAANDVGIKRIIVYPRYKPPKQYFDIALVELENEVSFRWLVHPACLWTSFENPNSGILTGWGVVDTSTLKSSTVLQKAEIRIVDSEDCNKTLLFKRNRNWWGIMRHQLCAGEETGRIDTCQGDSGGPLQSPITLHTPIPVFKWSLHKIVGVTSFGFGCAKANTPGIYTRVTSFLGWIESIVWPENIYFTEL